MGSQQKVDKEKSLIARTEGNNSFKKGKWVESIGHYTSAVIHDSEDPIAYCNRAQAYLKLEKFQDAERDCSSALERQKDNIKALYRRALARKGLDRYTEAIVDLQTLLRADSNNIQAKEELEDVERLEQSIAKQKKAKLDGKRPMELPSASTAQANPSVVHSPPSEENASSSATSSSFSNLRKSREAKKTGYVSSISSSTPARSKETERSLRQPVKSHDEPLTNGSDRPPSSARTIAPPSDPKSTASGSGLLLLRALQPLIPSEAWSLISLYPPENVAVILGPLLEPDQLGLLLLALQIGSQGDDKQKEVVKVIMDGLRSAPRIKMNGLMLDSQHAEAGRTAWRECGGTDNWP